MVNQSVREGTPERTRIDMTKGETFWVILSVFAMGELCGWACFGKPRLADVVVQQADWVAAAGTWVIGYMAWRLSKVNHEHQLRGAKQQASREAKRERAELQILSSEVWRAKGIAQAIRENARNREQTNSSFYTMAGTILKLAETLDFPQSAVPLLSLEPMKCLSRLKFDIMRLTDFVETARDIVFTPNKPDDMIDKDAYGWFTNIDEAAESLISTATELRQLIDVDIHAIGTA